MSRPPDPVAAVQRLFDDFDPACWPVIARSNQGLILRVQADGLDLAVKTPVGRGLNWRLRRATLRREHRAYRRLDGVSGLPACFGLFDDRWLVLKYMHGIPFRDAELDDRHAFFTRLLDSLMQMHDRGVAHVDLKRKANLLVTGDGFPVILDLGAAYLRKPGRRPFNQRLFRLMCQIDLNAWVKLKHGGYERVSAEDRRYLRRTRIERTLRRLRRR